MLRKVNVIIYLFLLKIKCLFLKKGRQKNILIIKVDAVGDYIIFRNFLTEISNRYPGYNITLMCNVLLKDLVAELDQPLIDSYIFINHKTLNSDWFAVLKQLVSRYYLITINFHYSRTFVTDILSFAAWSGDKIAIDGNDLNMNRYVRRLFNLCYGTKIQIPENITNEFAILKFFTEQITGHEIEVNQPDLQIGNGKFAQMIPAGAFVVFAPGAAVENRQSSVDALVKMANYVLKTQRICFVGSPNEIPLVEQIKDKIENQGTDNIIDLTGKTPLSALPYILEKSIGVICNDSGVYHIAVALTKPTLCLTGGGHFERFVNYPPQKNVRLSYHHMPCFNCDWKCIYKFPANEPYPCISAIELQNIFDNFSFLEQEFMMRPN